MGEGKTKSKTSSRQSLLARVTERSLMRWLVQRSIERTLNGIDVYGSGKIDMIESLLVSASRCRRRLIHFSSYTLPYQLFSLCFRHIRFSMCASTLIPSNSPTFGISSRSQPTIVKMQRTAAFMAYWPLWNDLHTMIHSNDSTSTLVVTSFTKSIFSALLLNMRLFL